MKQRGFTLIEIIVALALAAILLTGVMTSYLSLQRSTRLTQAFTVLQESGRSATKVLTQAVQQAGLANCASALSNARAVAVRGYRADTVPAWLKGKARSGSDVLVVHACKLYKGAQQFVATAYYVAKSSRKNSAGKAIYALYSKVQGSNRVELVSGVDNMQLEYGVVIDKFVSSYLAASQVSDWSKVGTVEVSLLLSSIQPALKKPQPYWFNGSEFQGTDRQLRKEWGLYVAVRSD